MQAPQPAPAPDQLRDVFRAIAAEVSRANGGEVKAVVICGPGGTVIDWHVDPARVKAQKGIDRGAGSTSHSR